MEPIKPELGLGPEIVIAEDQPQYLPLPAEAVRLSRRGVEALVVRFTFTPEERIKISLGEDLYLGIMTFGHPLQPLMPTVGPEELRDHINDG